MTPAFEATVLGRHRVQYYFCQESGLLQTEEPYWLEEAYSSAITEMDTGLAARNLLNRDRCAVWLHHMFGPDCQYADVAGGYGLLTRLMRDAGFRFYHYDKFCENIFARKLEPPPEFRADAVCAFEVFEHLTNPMEFITESFDTYKTDSMLFSTLLFYKDRVPPQDWWYYTFPTGQHVSFYQPRSLRMIAKKLGKKFTALSPDLHWISKHEPSPRFVAWMKKPWFSRYMTGRVLRNMAPHSLTIADSTAGTARVQG